MMESSQIPSDVDFRPSILVNDILYWPLKSKRNVHIMKTEDGGLGLAAVTKFNLRLWACGRPPVRILTLIEDDDLVFIWTKTGVFVVQLKTMKQKIVFEADVSATVYPYTGVVERGHENVAAE
ncbi:hypothetical protein BAE44_0000290 [Dichanthelium oligosanthes]|uniref:Uncharacterized protein n=1 Tax=Dichanthelium oligosanthes TaxID=888268 RepID=A0A1E5WNF6_9POAL|nr:hypothetical protein BAE44_0000290 [Dichanthelium oligosanthes]